MKLSFTAIAIILSAKSALTAPTEIEERQIHNPCPDSPFNVAMCCIVFLLGPAPLILINAVRLLSQGYLISHPYRILLTSILLAVPEPITPASFQAICTSVGRRPQCCIESIIVSVLYLPYSE